MPTSVNYFPPHGIIFPCKGKVLVMEWEWLLHKTRMLTQSHQGALRKKPRGWWDQGRCQDKEVTHVRYISKSIFVAFMKHFRGLT